MIFPPRGKDRRINIMMFLQDTVSVHICMYLLLISSINYLLIRNSLLLATYQIQRAVASNVYKHPTFQIRWASTEVDPASVPFKNKKQEKQRKAGALQFAMLRVGHSLFCW